MTRKPEHPMVKAAKRDRAAMTTAAAALYVLTAALVVGPLALGVAGAIPGEEAVVLTIFTSTAGLLVGMVAVWRTEDAWKAHNRACALADQAEWGEWKDQQRELERILREEGLK